jgi:hypothetical protein
MRTCFLLGMLALDVAGSDVSLEGVAERVVPDPFPEALDQLALVLVGRVAHMRPDAAIPGIRISPNKPQSICKKALTAGKGTAARPVGRESGARSLESRDSGSPNSGRL